MLLEGKITEREGYGWEHGRRSGIPPTLLDLEVQICRKWFKGPGTIPYKFPSSLLLILQCSNPNPQATQPFKGTDYPLAGPSHLSPEFLVAWKLDPNSLLPWGLLVQGYFLIHLDTTCHFLYSYKALLIWLHLIAL